ncbi:bifunctional GTP diphosphokinase/guanosine-3',5'-bis pyrophosphate 3'-pyrophosphohydrolase [soil metagenome]
MPATKNAVLTTDPYTELEHDLSAYLDPQQITNVYNAYLVAKKAHEGQMRQSGEAYITHPVAVARILATMRLDSQSVMAALLHDVIEDTSVDKKTLVTHFGEQVANLVDGVSKLTQIKFESRAEAQAENFRKMVLAMVRDIRVILIKLADRLHNMRTLGCLPASKRRRIALETLEIYAPIANRLGIHSFCIEFEDLGFAALYPMRYKILKDAVRKARGNRKEIMREIENEIKDRLLSYGLSDYLVMGREKHLYSIYRKMKAKSVAFSEIMDVYAFRIVVNSLDTCYRVLGAIHSLYKPISERFKDYIAIPKVNGYQSLHTTLFGPYGVPIEIQIRTHDMDRLAENGIASHWLYKSSTDLVDETQLRAREWLKNLMEMQKQTGNSLEFIENVKIDLFPDEVYVFTPKGRITKLPMGSTAVDFAYAVHSDIGNSCVAAKIDRRLAPLSTPIANGQTVEIITAPGARPNVAWLSFVITGKARANIRHYIKSQRRAESINLGEQLLAKSLIPFATTVADISQQQINKTLQQFNYEDLNELYEAIGMGNQLSVAVVRYLTAGIDKNAVKNLIRAETPIAQPLLIKGSQGLLVSFAECCRPIPGDPIRGVMSTGKGLVIHLEQCKHIAKLQAHPENCVDVSWEENAQGDFKVEVRVEVINERGVLARLASAIASADSNIEDISLLNHEGRYNMVNLTLSVRHRDHLAKVLQRIRAIRVVTRIVRTR